MATWRVNNSTLLGGEVCSQWQTNHAYSLGARCVPTTAYGVTAAMAFVYEVTTAGTSHATTQPTWPTTVGDTVVDNGVTWTCRSPSDGSWDNATCFLAYINFTAVAAGDTVLVDDGHSDYLTNQQFYLKGGTGATPIKYLCVDKANDSLSTGALVYNYGGHDYFNNYSYSYGITYKTRNMIYFQENPNCQVVLDHCKIWLETNGNAVQIGGNDSILAIRLINTDVQFDYASNTFRFPGGNSNFEWRGGSLIAANGVSYLFHAQYRNISDMLIADVDLSAAGDGANTRSLLDCTGSKTTRINFTRCKLPPASDSGFKPTYNAWRNPLQGEVTLHHCSNGDRYYDLYESSYEGIVEDETTIVRTGGASDGTTGFAYKMVSSANTVDNINGLISPPIHGWTSSTTSKTFTIEGIWDSATNIQDDEIWMELEYPADNSSGLGAVARDKCVILGTPADQATSAETWTTTGLTNANEFKLSVTVTPGKAGPITARVYLAKPSTTVYIDPKITEN